MSLLSATPQENLLALINTSNPDLPIPVTAENLYFGDGTVESDGVTTSLATVGMLGSPYTGYKTFTYTRINLSTAYDERPVLKSVGAPTLHRMLPIVNQFLGLNFTEDDVVDVDISAFIGGEQVNINVVAAPTSVGYTGQFVIQFFRLDVQLSAVVANTELTVMTYPVNPADEKQCVDMVTWGYDFSEDLSVLARSGGNWTNPSAVAALMAGFGFADWPTPALNGVADYATADYPEANPAFQRVTVQSNVSGSNYEGNALFHYNLS